MGLLGRPYCYSKLDSEDPEEVNHRRALFLIYRALERADALRRPSWLKVRICKLKIKVGKRSKKLRKAILLTLNSAKGIAFKQLLSRLKFWKFLRHGRIRV